ncbi:hypothetical protein AOQ84DRAFT_292646 [Glonium stellatum]|uniref:DUF7730 domain-containing protein n=1 Tax=Glonium stellatum TaxID=574774 RepID=A0A8E2JT89_9PEZI|nr:hypothetical protein AOQ84DRAFT_292646 [Glonium stellatum]
MPKLPSSRPRAITLSHSAIGQDSPFFTRLPLEMREKVYLNAFGRRSIHIDLCFDHVDFFGPGHANLRTPFFKDASTPKEWRWWSCVCHRMQKEVNSELFVLAFWLDRCRSGEQTYCQWVFADKSECFVGALGWLLSCHQAYSESISIMYSTNTFYLGQHVGEPLLFQNIDSLFLPQRLASMKSLELAWNFDHFGPKAACPDTGKPIFDTFLNTLTSNFPNLTKVHIEVQTENYVQERLGASLQPEESLLSTVIFPMDQMIAHFGTQLRFCELIVGWSYYQALRKALGESNSVETLFQSTSTRKFHRHADNGEGALEYWAGYLPDIIYFAHQ